MSSNPINLAFRFLLELIALVATGIWGWQQSEGLYSYLFAFGIPLILAAIWGTFAVPGDPSRSGKTVFTTPGIFRLIIELAFFVFASWALFDSGYETWSMVMAVCFIIHYALSYDRILWLIKK